MRQTIGRTMQAASIGVALAALLAACSSPEDVARKTGLAQAEASAAAATGAASADTVGAVAFADNAEKGGGSREFAYAWPAEVSAIAALAERLTEERDRLLGEQKADWETALADFAGEDCVSCKSLSLSKEWKVVADLPRYLSLSASIYVYTGGAHGNSGYGALVWDRETGQGLDPEAMFASAEGLQNALGDPWCKALKAEKKERLGADYSDDGFFPCPPVSDLTLLPGSSDGKSFNRIGLIAAPYVAGSYAEGAYEVTLPVTQAVLAAVKPEFKPAFALGK